MMYSLLSLSLFLVGSFAQTPPATTSSAASAATTGAGTTQAGTTSPPVVPVVVPPVPNPEPPVQQPPTNPGPNVVTPVPPTNPGTGTTQQPPVTPQQPPVRPQQPPATPQYGYPQQPQQPGFGAPGFMPGFGAGILDPQTLTCEFGQCRNRRITMTPGQGFKLECNMMRQCDGLALTLNIGVDPTNFGNQVNEINDFNFDAPQNGVQITMNNMFPGQNIEVNNINCKVFGACQNMRVTAGFGVELWEINMKCEVPGACTGCTINGQSCELVSMMTGSHHGGMMPGFGYMNQPNLPGAGGQAGFGGGPAPQTGFGAPAPQQPQYQQPQYNPYQYQQPQFYPQYYPWI